MVSYFMVRAGFPIVPGLFAIIALGFIGGIVVPEIGAFAIGIYSMIVGFFEQLFLLLTYIFGPLDVPLEGAADERMRQLTPFGEVHFNIFETLYVSSSAAPYVFMIGYPVLEFFILWFLLSRAARRGQAPTVETVVVREYD